MSRITYDINIMNKTVDAEFWFSIMIFFSVLKTSSSVPSMSTEEKENKHLNTLWSNLT